MSKQSNRSKHIRIEPKPVKLPAESALQKLSQLELNDREEYGEFVLQGVQIDAAQLTGLEINSAHLNKVRWNSLVAERSKITNTLMDFCDLSGQVWSTSKLFQVELAECKLTGFRFVEGTISEVRATKSGGRMPQFYGTEFKNCIFEGCVFNQADFRSCKFENVIFLDCDLSEAEIYEAKLDNVDLRGSRLFGIKAHPQDLKGAVIDKQQALEMADHFAMLLGIRIV